MADESAGIQGIPETISGPEAAKLIMLESPRRVQQLVEQGFIEKAERGRYITLSVIQGYIRFLKDVNKNAQQNTHTNRVADARAREIEMRNAKASHELIEYTEAESVLMEVAGMLKSEFDGFGARMTRDMSMRRKIEAGVDEIFKRANNRIAETLTALAESGEVVDTDATDES